MKAKLIKTENGYGITGTGIIAFYSSKRPVHKHYKLSKQNCDEIFGVVDVEKLAKEDADLRFPNQGDEESWLARNSGVVWGFNKAIELCKDKVFTLEDMKGYFDWHKKQRYVSHKPEDMDEYIQSLQQPTEIEVEIEMKKVVDETKVIGAVKGVKGSGDKITTYKTAPKLDPDGCLILKKI
jgi:hypothetical protein